MIPLKGPKEIDGMRAACAAASEVLDRLAAFIHPGVTTGEIDASAAEFIAESKSKSAFLGYKGFPGHACVSVNEEVVHGIGGKRRIHYGDIVKIDVGVVHHGWIGDTATTVVCGVLPPEVHKLVHDTEAILEDVIPLVTEGRKLGDISAFIEQRARTEGYGVVREFVGHGVGRKLHEEPQIPNYGKRGSGPRLKAGMTLAIEPMLNLGRPEIRILPDQWTVVTADGKPSAHFEHTVLVTKDMPEVLTWRRKSLMK